MRRANRRSSADAGQGRGTLSTDFFEVVRRRHSVRRFTAQPVPEAQIQQVLAAANRAPSAGNLQAYQIYVVRDPRTRRRLDAASGSQGPVEEASVVLVFCAVPGRSAVKYGARGEQLFCIQDATVACAYAQLAVAALGLASVWIGAVQEPEVVKEALQLDEDVWPVAFLPIGHPAEAPPPRPRRAITDLVREIA
ncbi:MAG: nitroreductase family protein [Candidatus Omnitrophica bacterium]|nr:nitroreductase family protein [Candidatus Omnitrophota bacterium]